VSTRDQADEIATLRQELATSEDTCAKAMAEVEGLREERDALRDAAKHLLQLVGHGADTVAVGGAIPALRRALDGGGQ